jgi:hypothetical protein
MKPECTNTLHCVQEIQVAILSYTKPIHTVSSCSLMIRFNITPHLHLIPDFRLAYRIFTFIPRFSIRAA